MDQILKNLPALKLMPVSKYTPDTGHLFTIIFTISFEIFIRNLVHINVQCVLVFEHNYDPQHILAKCGMMCLTMKTKDA